MDSQKFQCTSVVEYVSLEYLGTWTPGRLQIKWQYSGPGTCDRPPSIFVDWHPGAFRDEGSKKSGVLVLSEKPQLSMGVTMTETASSSCSIPCKLVIEHVEQYGITRGLAEVSYDLATCFYELGKGHQLDLVLRPLSDNLIFKAEIGMTLTIVKVPPLEPNPTGGVAQGGLYRDCVLIDASGATVPASRLTENTLIGLYFSASWCPPCQRFIPKLLKFYGFMKEHKKMFEVVYISSDYSEKDMMEHMTSRSIPWLAVKHGDPEAQKLRKHWGIESVPEFIITTPAGAEICRPRKDVVSTSDNATKALALYEQWRDLSMNL